MKTRRGMDQIATCGDADDMFSDVKKSRLYLSCGERFLAVMDVKSALNPLQRIPTRSGARTALFEPSLDCLFVAIPATSTLPASIWVYRPM